MAEIRNEGPALRPARASARSLVDADTPIGERRCRRRASRDVGQKYSVQPHPLPLSPMNDNAPSKWIVAGHSLAWQFVRRSRFFATGLAVRCQTCNGF